MISPKGACVTQFEFQDIGDGVRSYVHSASPLLCVTLSVSERLRVSGLSLLASNVVLSLYDLSTSPSRVRSLNEVLACASRENQRTVRRTQTVRQVPTFIPVFPSFAGKEGPTHRVRSLGTG